MNQPSHPTPAALRKTLALLSLVLLAAGCTQGQPAVNRVQANVLDKHLFDGEWYFQQTVIDTPYSASYTFVGEQGSLEKIEWEVQQDFLIARRAYQYIANSEPDGVAGETETGAAIAMYRIQSHFDIRRSYNPVTGEEMNVIEENTSDRLWYERDYFRVDWSENLVTNNDFLVGARIFDGIETEPVAYFVEPGTGHPHEPKFVRDEDDATVSYMDIVNKMFVRPTTVDIPGFGEIPTCYLLTNGHLDCAPGEITVRNSFLRVDPERDYEPMEYTGDRMERFGYFVTERAGYDEDYGVVESARLRFANRHNLWEQSHQRDAAGELVRCTESTADVCGAGGARCDSAFGMTRRERNDADTEWLGACTIPYRERQIRPIAYHVSANFPADLIGDAQSTIDGWNAAFNETVGSLRENECLADGGDAASCASERTLERRTFVMCHNPVTAEDDVACGGEGTVAEPGDLRYSLLGWVSEPHASSPLGYGPSSADPETGEIIMGNAFIYGAAMETLQSFARDIIAVLNDDYSETDISSGEVARAWVERNRDPGSVVTGRPADDHVTSIDGYNVDRVDAAMDFSWADRFREAGVTTSPLTSGNLADRVEAFDAMLNRLGRAGAFGEGEGRGAARLASLRDTEIERLLTGPEMRMAAGIDPLVEPDEEAVLDRASPFRGMSLGHLNAIERAHQRMHQEGHCILHADFADEGMLGLARAIQTAVRDGDGTLEWYGQNYDVTNGDGDIDYAQVNRMVRHPIFHGVTQHELGHTVGLRHNFSGSFDALNYAPRYWDLRNDGDMRPRAWDPLSQAEIDGRIREYQYSTVMDYGNNFVVTDAEGLGHYDHAAIKMGYGDMVEVFADVSNPQDVNWWHFIQTAGWPVPLKLSAFTGSEGVSAYQYTDWPSVIGGLPQMQDRRDVAYTSLRPDSYLASQGITDRLVDAEGRSNVPYMFCSDEQRDLGPDCYLYDAGADPYETVNSVIDNYWNYYIFNSFARGRLGFSTESAAERVHGRYFKKLKYANQIYSLYRTLFSEVFEGNTTLESFYTRPDGMGAYTAAVGSAFELLTRVVTNPEPDNYRRTYLGDGTEALIPGGTGLGGSVDPFQGRALTTTWNYDAGYYWFDQLDRVGYFYDKAVALQVLVDPQTNFLGRDTAADVRRYQLSFYTSFAPAMTGFMRGLVGEDWETVAPRLSGDEVIYPDPLQLADASMPGIPVDPNASFSIQLAASVYGMAMIPETFDRTYFERARVWLQNGPEGVTPSAETPVVSFTDPSTGLTYMAMSHPDEDGVETAPGAEMLAHAQALLDNGAMGELTRYMDNVNLVRRLSWTFDLGSGF